MTDDSQLLTRALRDRMADEHADLDRLAGAAARAGTRVVRRRRAVAGIGTLAATAAIVAGATSLPGLVGGTAADPSIGPAPMAPASATDDAEAAGCDAQGVLVASRDGGGPLRLTRMDVSDDGCAPATDPQPPARIALDADMVSCSQPADDKLACGGPSGHLTVAWRPAAQREAFLADAGEQVGTVDMLGGTGVLTDELVAVGPVRDGSFVTVSGGQDADEQDVRELAAALLWAQ